MKTLVKELAGHEDLNIGYGTVFQNRSGANVPVRKIELPWIFRSVEEIRALDVSKYTRVWLHTEGTHVEYWYDSSDSRADNGTAILQPNTLPATGRWVRLQFATLVDVVNNDEEPQLSSLYDLVGQYDGETVETAGYWRYHDGGAGRWTWSATAIDADNGGTTVQPLGYIGAGRWIRQVQELVTPAMFGGYRNTAGDSAAAVLAAWNSGYRVHLDGWYEIDSSITLPYVSWRTMTGNGWGNCGLRATSVMAQMLYLGEDTTIEGLAFVGFDLDCNGLASKGLWFLEGKNFQLFRVRVLDHNDIGMHFSRPGAGGASFYEMTMFDCKVDGLRTRTLATPRSDAPEGMVFDDGATDNKIIVPIVSYVQNNGIRNEAGSNVFVGGHIYGGMDYCFWNDNEVQIQGTYFDTPITACVWIDAPGTTLTGCKYRSNPSFELHNPDCVGITGQNGQPVRVNGGTADDLAYFVDPNWLPGFRTKIDIQELDITNPEDSDIVYDNFRLRGGGTRDVDFELDTAAGESAAINWTSGGSSRWLLEKTGDDETGSNAGSRLRCGYYDDTGTTFTTLFQAFRDFGQINFVGGVEFQGNVGFYDISPQPQPVVTGSRGGNVALANLLNELAQIGLIQDNTTA